MGYSTIEIDNYKEITAELIENRLKERSMFKYKEILFDVQTLSFLNQVLDGVKSDTRKLILKNLNKAPVNAIKQLRNIMK